MTEREKGPGPTLPAEIWAHRWWHTLRDPANGGVMAATSLALAVEQREETIRFGEDHPLSVTEVVRYVRADEEREKLVEAVLARVRGEPDAGCCECCHMIYWDGLTPDDPLKDTYVHEGGCPVGALEAHDAKGEAGDDAATRPPSPHSP